MQIEQTAINRHWRSRPTPWPWAFSRTSRSRARRPPSTPHLKGAIRELIERKEFTGKAYETAPLLVPVGQAKQVLVVGLGKRDKFDAGMAYRASTAAAASA